MEDPGPPTRARDWTARREVLKDQGEVDGTVAAIASLMKTPRPGDVNCNLVLGGAGMQGSNGDLSMPA